MLGAEIRANYFADLSGRYAFQQRAATWCTLVASSGAAASILANLPEQWSWLRPALALSTAAISLYSIVMQNQKFSVDSSDLHARWSGLANDYQRLWDDMYSDDAPGLLNALANREVELFKAAMDLPNRKSLMEKWQAHVVSNHAAELNVA